MTPQNSLLIFFGKETHSETTSWTSIIFLLLSFSFFHLLFFLGCSKSDFFWPQLLHDFSLKFLKKHVFRAVSGSTPLRPRLLCFSLFLVFFVRFFFSFIFSNFVVCVFSFFCISFKDISLLASVSEFNCFLRSRCSMEMWCPDDIGRDSWDWVGPPAWVRACFNSPEWGGGSSPVKTEPPQIVLLFLTGLEESDVCVHTTLGCNNSR